MGLFKEFKRSQISEIRTIEPEDLKEFGETGFILSHKDKKVSISDTDLRAGSPKKGDRIARNPKDHSDQWLIAESYFKDNFEAY